MENVGFAFAGALLNLIHSVIWLYIWIVIIASLITWVRPDPYNPIVQILYKLTEPVYEKIRKHIPTNFGGIDIAPIIVLLALNFFDAFLGNLFR